MSDRLFKISAKGAFSHAWNKGIDSNASCVAKWRSSMKALMNALFYGYKVSKADVGDAFINNGSHANSIFGKEYFKLQKSNLVTVLTDTKEKSNNSSEQELFSDEKNILEVEEVKVAVEKVAVEEVAVEEVAVEETNRVIAVKTSLVELEKLMSDGGFNIDDERFSEESLKLLESKDCLQLLNKAFALQQGDLALRLLLIDNCNLSDDEQKAFAYFFAMHDITGGVRFLLEKNTGNLIHWKNKSGTTLLMTVVEYCHDLECLEMLLNKGAKVNDTDNMGRTPLHLAAADGRTECLQVLLDNGANTDVNRPCKKGMTALCYAAKQGHLTCLKAILRVPGVSLKMTTDHQGALSMTCCGYKSEHLDCFNALMAFDINASKEVDGKGRTPLSYAIEYNHQLFIEALLCVDGIDVNAEDNIGRTLLMMAIEFERKKCFDLLLGHKDINVNKQGIKGGARAIYSAVEIENAYYLNALLNKDGIDINVQNDHGETPLHNAMANNALKCIRLLLRNKKVRFNLVDNHNNTLLHCAVKNGNAQKNTNVVKNDTDKYLGALLSVRPGVRPYVNNTNNDGDTALHIAVQQGNVGNVKKLLEILGIDISIKAGQGGLTPLGIAEKLGNEECAKLLREYDAMKNKDKE